MITRQRRCLVTGGAGFIGSHLCERLLEAGFEVVSFDNFNDYYDPVLKRRNILTVQQGPDGGRFRSVEGDIRDASAVERVFEIERPWAVIHLAAMAGVRPSIQRPLFYTDVNVRGTQTVLEACSRHGTRNVVFASSSSVYGNNRKVPFAEIDPVDHPISPYAATKKAGELLCYTYAHLHRLSVSCLRFFTVYGPRQRPDLAIHKFTKLMAEGKEIPFYGDGSTSRDYTFVDDIVDGTLRALEWTGGQEGRAYEVFNLGGSEPVSLREMIAALERATGRSAQIKTFPAQEGDVVRTYADISKAEKILGYRPGTSFSEGLASFAAWFDEKGALYEAA